MDKSNIKLDTISNTHKRLRENGYMVSECTVRGWVRSGLLASIRCGRKSLIFYDKTVQLIESGKLNEGGVC